jgi:hypothetical protein
VPGTFPTQRCANGPAVQSAVVPRKRIGFIVIGVLLAASGLAFLRAEQLKLERSPVGGTRVQKYFSTTCTPVKPGTRCRAHSALMSFRLRRAGRVALAIVDGSGHLVDRLGPAAGRPLPRGRVTLRWDGRTAAGATAPEGTYHLQVDLLSLHQTITTPDPIELDNTAPTLTLVTHPGTLPVHYRTSEPAAVFVRATGTGANAGRSAIFRARSGDVGFGHRTSLAGTTVRLTLVAVDRAGNASAPLAAGSVRLPA